MIRIFTALAMSLSISATVFAEPIKVELKGEPGKWQLLRDGKPYFVKGAGGSGSQKLLAEVGANSGRTWGADDLGKRLDEAHALGLSITVGIWLGHPRHGFNYNRPESVAEQYEMAKAAILKYKDHPAVLMWGIGNEMEGEGDDAAIWSAINNIASMAKRLDPNHPTMTVIAELGKNKIQNIHRLCPDIDVIGLNTYGGGPTIGDRYTKAGGTKPYILTEFGPGGTWEQGRNDFGAPVEKTSTQKADAYRDTYVKTVKAHPGYCLGSYAFTWGNKIEATSTWFGMLLPDESRLAATDTLSELWTGRPVPNRCPTIQPLSVETTDRTTPGGTLRIRLTTSDPERDALTVQWVLQREVGQYETGGDAIDTPPTFPAAIVNPSLTGVEVRMPDKPGIYRLYVYVRDNHGGAATANLPLLCQNPNAKN